jgi:hypothetical protein
MICLNLTAAIGIRKKARRREVAPAGFDTTEETAAGIVGRRLGFSVSVSQYMS